MKILFDMFSKNIFHTCNYNTRLFINMKANLDEIIIIILKISFLKYTHNHAYFYKSANNF